MKHKYRLRGQVTYNYSQQQTYIKHCKPIIPLRLKNDSIWLFILFLHHNYSKNKQNIYSYTNNTNKVTAKLYAHNLK